MVFPGQRPNNRMFQNPNLRQAPNQIQQMIQSVASPQSPVASIANKSFGNISKTLSNVQQVIKVVQSATPVVQEYAPMVKNLPAMYRMVKALKSVDDDNVEVAQANPENEVDTPILEDEKQEFSGQSTPKLYI